MECFRVSIDRILNLVSDEGIVDDSKTSDTELVIRLPLTSEEEAQRFREEISVATSTNWVTYNKCSNPKRFVYHESWKCHHSNYGKKTGSKRSTGCCAKLEIMIKKLTKGTKKNDAYLKCVPPLCCEVKIYLDHNHTVDSAIALGMLRVSDEVKNHFYSLFSDGLTPSQAISVHENSLLCQHEYEQLANAAINPNGNQVYYLHRLWRSENFGSYHNPFEKLEEKLPFYAEKGATVKYKEGDSWAVLLVTSVMKRAQTLYSSKEVIFVDSSCSCEMTSSTLTILLTVTKAGAIPIAVLVHQGQTMENYTDAFQLLKKEFLVCFGGNHAPDIFMTDDSSAVKGALKKVWLHSRQLLCHFHVAQAEWRWLFSQGNIIPSHERPRLMKLFQAVMYAGTEETLNKAVHDVAQEAGNHPSFVYRFFEYLKRRMEWVLLDRDDVITRGNNTNNYAEATVRIIKDVVLCRTKAFNVVALIEFCISVWEDYLTRKLLNFAYSRKSKPYTLYKSLMKNSKCYKPSQIIEAEPNVFIIQGAQGDVYVNSEFGVCSCYAGKFGAFCKHQCALVNSLKIKLPNAPAIDPGDKHELGFLALGDKCPSIDFYGQLSKNSDLFCEPMVLNETTNDIILDDDIEASEEEKIELVQQFRRLADLVQNTPKRELSKSHVRRTTNVLKQVRDKENLSRLMYFRSMRMREKNIPVQPTSVARRRPGLVRGCKRVPSGRPPKALNKKILKRKRCLAKNISENIPNAR